MSHFVIYDEIDRFVDSSPNLSWEGWDVLAVKKNLAGWMKKNGVQKDGVWYVQTRVSPDPATGAWVFPDRSF